MNRAELLLFLAPLLWAQDARQIVEEAQRRARVSSQRYEGTLEVVDAKSKTSAKHWQFERMGDKSLLRFTAPPEVKGVALLIVNHPDRPPDQWMWIPANGRERRIAPQDRGTRFFGTDFSFEDLAERDAAQFNYKLLGEENGSWKIESRPKESRASQYTSLRLWIRKDNYFVSQVEGYDKGGLARRIRFTPGSIEAWDARRKSRTILKLQKVQVNVPMKEGDFTVEALGKE